MCHAVMNNIVVIIASLAAEIAAMYYRSAHDRAVYAINDKLNKDERCTVDECIEECPACNVAWLERETLIWHIID